MEGTGEGEGCRPLLLLGLDALRYFLASGDRAYVSAYTDAMSGSEGPTRNDACPVRYSSQMGSLVLTTKSLASQEACSGSREPCVSRLLHFTTDSYLARRSYGARKKRRSPLTSKELEQRPLQAGEGAHPDEM